MTDTRQQQNDNPKTQNSDCPENFKKQTKKLEKAEATRKSSQSTLDSLAPGLPELVGGSADSAMSCFNDRGNLHRFGCGMVCWYPRETH